MAVGTPMGLGRDGANGGGKSWVEILRFIDGLVSDRGWKFCARMVLQDVNLALGTALVDLQF